MIISFQLIILTEKATGPSHRSDLWLTHEYFVARPMGLGHSRLIFYFWFDKLTIIKYLTPLTSTRAGRFADFVSPRFKSHTCYKINRPVYPHWVHYFVARPMGLEPTTSPVTGERSSQLNYGRLLFLYTHQKHFSSFLNKKEPDPYYT